MFPTFSRSPCPFFLISFGMTFWPNIKSWLFHGHHFHCRKKFFFSFGMSLTPPRLMYDPLSTVNVTQGRKKKSFPHGRSKIGLFLVVHRNSYSLFMWVFFSPGMLRNRLPPQGKKQLVKNSLFFPREVSDSSSKNTTSWPWEKSHSLPWEIPRLIVFFPRRSRR